MPGVPIIQGIYQVDVAVSRIYIQCAIKENINPKVPADLDIYPVWHQTGHISDIPV